MNLDQAPGQLHGETWQSSTSRVGDGDGIFGNMEEQYPSFTILGLGTSRKTFTFRANLVTWLIH